MVNLFQARVEQYGHSVIGYAVVFPLGYANQLPELIVNARAVFSQYFKLESKLAKEVASELKFDLNDPCVSLDQKVQWHSELKERTRKSKEYYDVDNLFERVRIIRGMYPREDTFKRVHGLIFYYLSSKLGHTDKFRLSSDGNFEDITTINQLRRCAQYYSQGEPPKELVREFEDLREINLKAGDTHIYATAVDLRLNLEHLIGPASVGSKTGVTLVDNFCMELMETFDPCVIGVSSNEVGRDLAQGALKQLSESPNFKSVGIQQIKEMFEEIRELSRFLTN